MTWLSFSLILATGYDRKLQSPTDCHAPDFVFLKSPCALFNFERGRKGKCFFEGGECGKGKRNILKMRWVGWNNRKLCQEPPEDMLRGGSKKGEGPFTKSTRVGLFTRPRIIERPLQGAK